MDAATFFWIFIGVLTAIGAVLFGAASMAMAKGGYEDPK